MENIELCHPDEIVRIRKVLSKCPGSLFKYKKFNKWTFDMIENSYAYLSPVKDLDDPFDCLSDFDITKIIDQNNKTVKGQFLNHIFKTTMVPITEHDKEIAKEYKDAFKPGDEFDRDRIYEALKNEGMPEDKIEEAMVFFGNCLNVSDTYKDNGAFDRFGKILLNPGETIGVCALSEIKDNKVMWSLYGKEYKGCCIEYGIKPTKTARRFLFPVIYSREPNNNFTEKIVDTVFAETQRQMFQDIFMREKPIENVGAIYELFCAKDIDWKFQKEWRLVGDAKDHFSEVEIKAVYLGFKVAKTNEERMKTLSKRCGFALYKMKSPDGKKRIRFSRIK